MTLLAALALTQATARPVDVARLVRQVRAAYKSCKTYRDHGTQVIWNIDSRGSKTIWGEWKFATIFERPAKLRLEVNERSGSRWVTSVLWTPRKGSISSSARLYIGLDGSVTRVDDLWTGFSSLATLCSGIADRVPVLLIPSKEPFDLLDEHKWKSTGVERLGGRDCYVLRSSDSSSKIWVDKRTTLIVQLHEWRDHGGGRSTLKMVQYTPKINIRVQGSEFKVVRS